MTPIQLGVWHLNIAAGVILILRLWQTGLLTTYRWLGLYLGVDLVESLLFLYFLRIHSGNHYAETYMAGQGVKMVLSVFVLLELYRSALAGWPAIASFGRQTLWFALLLTSVIAVLGLILDRSMPSDQPVILYRYAAIERTMDVWALLFLLLITGFMLWFPVKLMRNAAIYLLGFIVYFSARSAGLLLLNVLAHRYTPVVDSAMLCVSLCCLLFWVVTLRRESEDRATVIGHRWDRSAAERLSAQLDAINTSLLRLSRR